MKLNKFKLFFFFFSSQMTVKKKCVWSLQTFEKKLQFPLFYSL